MNPLNEHLKASVTVCIIVAVIVAFAVGVNLPLVVRLVDGISFGTVMFLTEIILLWNTFRYTIPVYASPKFRIFFVTSLTFVACALVIGIETLIIYLSFPSSFDFFIPTIPIRAIITYLIFIITYLLYEIIDNNRKKYDRYSAINSMDSSDPTTSEKSDNEISAKASPNPIVDRITVRIGQKIKIIPIDDILYVKADGDYISIRTPEGRWLKEQTMKHTEDQLPIHSFVRIHRSFIVNIHRINRIERFGEKQQIVLSNNEKIKISAARYQTLKQILGI